MKFSLIRHPSTFAPTIDSIDVEVTRLGDSRLRFRYRLDGDISTIAMPPLVPATRTDELWKATCFEAFFARADKNRYAELNFSPSSSWAGYIFEDYREGRRDFLNSTLPRIDMAAGVDHFELRATVDIAGNVDDWRNTDLLIGLSAVIETLDGQKSYWALAHPDGAPNFHHRDCFAGLLRAPEAP